MLQLPDNFLNNAIGLDFLEKQWEVIFKKEKLNLTQYKILEEIYAKDEALWVEKPTLKEENHTDPNICLYPTTNWTSEEWEKKFSIIWKGNMKLSEIV